MEPQLHIDAILNLLNNFTLNNFQTNFIFNNNSDPVASVSEGLQLLTRELNQKKTAQNLDFDNQDFKLFHLMPDAIVAVNSNQEIVFFNTQAQELFGYQKNEILGKILNILIPDKFHEHHTQNVNTFFNKSKSRQMGMVDNELFGRKKTGEEFPVDISLSYIETPTYKIAISTIRDFTEKKLLIEKIKKSEEKLNMLQPKYS